MKNRMPLRKAIGKISTFLKTKKSKTSTQSYFRRLKRGTSEFPNSSKIGASSENVKARRNLPQGVLHKRNHRSNEMIGFGY